MRDRKVVLKALILVFLIYLGVFFACVVGYLKWRADYIKFWTEFGTPESELHPQPFWVWDHSWLLIYSGFSVVFAIMIAASERMYKRVFKIAASYAFISLGCAFAVVVKDILELQATLNWLYSDTEMKMASVFILWYEKDLHVRLTQLWSLIAVTTVVVCGLTGIYWRSRGATHKATHKHVLQTMTSLFLVLALLMPLVTPTVTVTAEVTHLYGRVEMYVPQDAHLTKVYGYVAPRPAGAVNGWVCHHIAVGFPRVHESIGAGYYHDETKGTVYYIEWSVGGVYHEITAPGVIFDEQIMVEVYELEQGWEASVHDSYGLLILQKSVTELATGETTLGIAGGESIDPDNRMESSFSGLWWRSAFGQSGCWDGDPFPCAVIHDAPYDTTIEVPYYEFTVSGGYGKTLMIPYAGAGGTTAPEAGAYTYTQGSNVTVKATPSSCYTFEYWLLDETTNYENPITVTMTADHTLYPVFEYQGGGFGGPPSGPPRDTIWGNGTWREER